MVDSEIDLEDLWLMLLMMGKITMKQWMTEDITIVNIRKFYGG